MNRYLAVKDEIRDAAVAEVLHEEFIRAAYARGLSAQQVLWRHALRNALVPVLAYAGVHLSALVGGTVIVAGKDVARWIEQVEPDVRVVSQAASGSERLELERLARGEGERCTQGIEAGEKDFEDNLAGGHVGKAEGARLVGGGDEVGAADGDAGVVHVLAGIGVLDTAGDGAGGGWGGGRGGGATLGRKRRECGEGGEREEGATAERGQGCEDG